MLKIFDTNSKEIGLFHNYDDVIDFITTEENSKYLNDSAPFKKGCWTFADYSPTQLEIICAWVKPEFLTTPQLKALEKGLGLLEICRGDFFALQEVVVTAEINVEEFRKKFCLDYCRFQGWRLIESQSHKPPKMVLVRDQNYIVPSCSRKARNAYKNLNDKRAQRLKEELDCRIKRLRQQPVAAKLMSPPNPTRKGGI